MVQPTAQVHDDRVEFGRGRRVQLVGAAPGGPFGRIERGSDPGEFLPGLLAQARRQVPVLLQDVGADLARRLLDSFLVRVAER